MCHVTLNRHIAIKLHTEECPFKNNKRLGPIVLNSKQWGGRQEMKWEQWTCLWGMHCVYLATVLLGNNIVLIFISSWAWHQGERCLCLYSTLYVRAGFFVCFYSACGLSSRSVHSALSALLWSTVTGNYLLTSPPLSFYKNESTNFSVDERAAFGIWGKLNVCVAVCAHMCCSRRVQFVWIKL